ncbi:MAG: ATP-binding protein [Dysgonamonadaceae bacterium]|nr:ATP-binding protein [Dysgonamonadaceae bacterium]
MQKIAIKNFGPITEAEIELRKSIVLIGEQASGKSTVAKLVYYFKSLREDLFNKIYNESFNDDFAFDYTKYLIFPLREKFYDFFGSTHHMKNFQITFYYSLEENKFLTLTLNPNKELFSEFNPGFIKGLSMKLNNIRKLLPTNIDKKNISAVLAYNQEKLKYAEQLSNLLKERFCCRQDDDLFIIAGRNATVGYSDSFEKQFLLNAQTQIEESYKKKQQTIDETLMLDFMNRVIDMKDSFKKFGNFESYSHILETGIKNELQIVIRKIHEILQGKYQIDTYGEKLIFDSNANGYVYLSNASSGQQEIIRILQDIFLTIAQNTKVLRIVEEPEVHLFPVAQKKVIELLVQMAKNTESNQLIINTHSPYVLTVFNNLLLAQRVVDKNPDSEAEVSKITGKEAWLKADDFSAYVLERNNNQIIAKSIVDDETGMIEQNYLDTVSELLGNEFNALYGIQIPTPVKTPHFRQSKLNFWKKHV